MKNSFIVGLVACLSLAACSKATEELTTLEEATVYTIKYACGPACTGQGWIITTTTGNTFEPLYLPVSFETDELPVKVTYRRTGKRSAPNAGTGEELIEIEHIEKR
jgi:hypothetical protein